MQVEAEGDRLIVHDRPGCLWLFGFLFIIPSAVMAPGVWLFFSDRATTSAGQKLVASVAGAIAFAAGLIVLWKNPFRTVVFDRQTGHALLQERGLRRRDREMPMSAIREVRLESNTDDESSRIWRVVLITDQGAEPLGVWSHDERGTEESSA